MVFAKRVLFPFSICNSLFHHSFGVGLLDMAGEELDYVCEKFSGCESKREGVREA